MEISENERELRELLGDTKDVLSLDQKKELLDMISQTELSMAKTLNAGKTSFGGLEKLDQQTHLFWDQQPLSGKPGVKEEGKIENLYEVQEKEKNKESYVSEVSEEDSQETKLPKGFEWCSFDLDTKKEDELSAILDELVEFLKANYFSSSR